MYVAACRVTGAMPDPALQQEMVTYLRGVQNPDGGFGLGEENPSFVFTSALNYVALRMLGLSAADPDVTRCRTWMHAQGGAIAAASWGKFFLSVLNLHAWEGLQPVPPETWLLPRSLPVHPWRMWCHSRMVYLPMSWLYGARATAPVDDLIVELRRELYVEPWERIDWARHRDTVACTDAYTPHSAPMKLTHAGLRAWERAVPTRLRQRALAEVLEQCRYEDEITSFICIGPVNKVYNTLVAHFAEPGGEQVRNHLAKLPIYLHRDGRGARMNGYNSSELWDTAFALQALSAADRPEQSRQIADRAFAFVDAQQVRVDPPDAARHYRDPSKGGWPFSTLEHGWPITDCTAEGLKVSIALEHVFPGRVPRGERWDDAVRLILGWQNPDGGFASYERTRGPAWLELLNPSDAFGEIMIDYSHTECTSACVQALAAYRAACPGRYDGEIEATLQRAEQFLRAKQGPDGGWEGGWAVCFTYGTWFAVNGLLACGAQASDAAIQRAARFILDHQMSDGGWGEHVESCRHHRWVPTETGQAVQTSWAVLTLIAAGLRSHEAVRRGVAFLEARMQADGHFPPEHIAGVFNRTCAIQYDLYRQVFPIWAMGAARTHANH
jgi:squalene/oxidosqualene cyclase-like protein